MQFPTVPTRFICEQHLNDFLRAITREFLELRSTEARKTIDWEKQSQQMFLLRRSIWERACSEPGWSSHES
jgi:hypothetical protein